MKKSISNSGLIKEWFEGMNHIPIGFNFNIFSVILTRLEYFDYLNRTGLITNEGLLELKREYLKRFV